MDQRGEDRFRVILRRSAHPRSLTFTIHSRVHAPVRVHTAGLTGGETRGRARLGKQLDADGAVPARCCGPACSPDPSRPAGAALWKLRPDLAPMSAEQMLAVLLLWRLYRMLLPAPSLGVRPRGLSLPLPGVPAPTPLPPGSCSTKYALACLP